MSSRDTPSRELLDAANSMAATNTGDADLTYGEALYQAMRFSLIEDPTLSVVGSFVFGLSASHLMDELRDEFPGRVLAPPISEAGLIGAAVGAGMAGAATFISIGTSTFSFPAFSSIFNEAAVGRYMSNGQLSVPLTLHMMHGVRGGGAAQHSYSPHALFWNCPGLEVVTPSCAHDAKGLLRTALKSENPTIFLDHTALVGSTQSVPVDDYEIPFGKAAIRSQGSDVTLISSSRLVGTALAAADELAAQGVGVEVIDLRTLRPLDEDAVVGSVTRTGRVAVLDEGYPRCGVAAELCATVATLAFEHLKAAPLRLARLDVPVPFSPALEAKLLPSMPDVVAALSRLVAEDQYRRRS